MKIPVKKKITSKIFFGNVKTAFDIILDGVQTYIGRYKIIVLFLKLFVHHQPKIAIFKR